jgi:hypothetical protein
MKDNLEFQLGDAPADESSSSPNRSRIGSGNSKFLGILLGILLVLIFAGGLLYFFSKRPTGDEVSSLQSKVTALEQKNAQLEKNLENFREKSEP